MTDRKSGFTLIEIALAILVVAIGVLAVFALMSAGLDNSVRAIDDTHAAMFADNVFNGLRSVSSSAAESQRQVKGVALGSTNCPWENFWNSFAGGTTSITISASPVWRPDGSQPLAIKVGVDDPVFGNVSQRGITTTIDDHALRYQLEVLSRFGSWNPLWTNVALVTLKVWPGRFGQTLPEDALVFYSEFANPGDL